MLSISSTVKSDAPKDALFFRSAAEKVLGRDYDLSLVFVGDMLSRRLNREHRGHDRPTDILSFPLEKDAGEIFINVPYSMRKCRKFGRPFPNYARFIFIHGLFHLKGYAHGSRMESEEKKIRNIFNV